MYSNDAYISNVRMTTTNVYDVNSSNIPVPITNFTNILGTQLLMNTNFGATWLVDSSSNNITMVASGSPSSSNYEPFTPVPLPTPTPSVTPTQTPTPSVTPTQTPTPSVTTTQTPTPTPTNTVTPTNTETPTNTPTNTPTPTITPTNISCLNIATNSSGGLTGFNTGGQAITFAISSNPAVGTTYPVGSFITFQNGEVRTLAAVENYGAYYDVFYSSPISSLTLFPITICYPSIPTPTPTPTSTTTPTPTTTSTPTPSVTNTVTPTSTLTPTPTPTSGGGGGDGWLFYGPEGPLSVGPPQNNGNTIFRILSGDIVTYNPNYTGTTMEIYFNTGTTLGTSYLTQFQDLDANGGTLTASQGSNTVIYSGSSSQYNIGPGFLLLQLTSFAQMVQSASTAFVSGTTINVVVS
jgi:outer membrane biosynthesis protein TonB